MSFDYAALDIVCFYMHLNRPYAPLMQRMCESAKAVMPDCRTVLLTQTPTAELRSIFDVTYHLPEQATPQTLCRERAVTTASWAIRTDRPCVFVDPDIEFRKPVPVEGDYDVGLIWRKRDDQPINTGAVIAKPGHPLFWRRYGKIAINLPAQIHFWWCDQLAYSLITGVHHKPGEVLQCDDARVLLMDSANSCGLPDEITDQAWATHYKGRLKGEGWEKIFVGGKQPPVSVKEFHAAS